jgi:hypothetical protein
LELKNKTILLISPQAWGNMYLAKHHYAIALAKYGNEVYFLNPPSDSKIKNEVEVVKSNIHPSLYIVNHSLFFSKKIKFKFIWLFHFFMKFHIDKIKKNIAKEIDIVWSFDLGNYYPFKSFSSSYKIFSPFDKAKNKVFINSAVDCDIIISPAYEIIESYNQFNVPKHFIHHGLAEEFFNQTKVNRIDETEIRIGLSGNWLRKDIDTKRLLHIINENPEVIFEFWGVFQTHQSNIGGEEGIETADLMVQLGNLKNVVIHGVKHPKELAIEFQRMDGFLICYNILKDQSNGINYHKIIEYLSTGKVVISNNITTYSSLPNLIVMTTSSTHNNELPTLFKTVIDNLQHFNQTQFVAARKEFAFSNLYYSKIAEIEKLIRIHN